MSSAETIKYLEVMCAGMTERELCHCWCDMQRYVWPPEFRNVMPDGFDQLTRKQKNQMPVFLSLWNMLIKHTTERQRLRAWNVEMTDEEFAEYWRMLNTQDPE